MFSWLRKKKPEPARAPLVRREKTYSAMTGHVYQYRFLRSEGTTHVFGVTAGSAAPFLVRVELDPAGLKACEDRMGTPLRWNELYALAKLKFFQAMDESESPALLASGVCASQAELLGFLRELRMSEE